MQHSFTTAISTVLLASALTSAGVIPRQAGQAITEIDLLLKTGDGDASVGREILKADFGSLLSQDSTCQTFDGVSLRTFTEGIQCGVFDPKTGASLNGLTFNGTSDDAVFGKNASSGEVDSSIADAVEVAVCCDVTASFSSTCSKPKPKVPKGCSSGSTTSASSSTTSTSTTTSAASTTSATTTATATATSSSDHGKFFPVEMQLSGLSELSVPATVIANGIPQPVRNAVGIQNIHITKQHQPVQCNAFADAEGKKQVGQVFFVEKTGVRFSDFVFLAGVDVNSVACKPIVEAA